MSLSVCVRSSYVSEARELNLFDANAVNKHLMVRSHIRLDRQTAVGQTVCVVFFLFVKAQVEGSRHIAFPRTLDPKAIT